LTARITVVTAVLNQADALRQTLRSVFDQSYPSLDYIIVDGASTDGTVDVITENEGRLAAWVSEPDGGVYDAMNKGWDLAAADSYLLFLGAGDKLLSLPDKMWLGDLGGAVVYGNVNLDEGAVFHARTGSWLKLYNSLHHQALLIPKRLHPEPPFSPDYPLYADFDFNQRLLKKGVPFRFAPDLQAYAAPGGLTRELDIDELAAVTRMNFGCIWSGLARAGLALSKCFPPIRRLRPIR
jgi:glycosyltransferase involved in cell wall biosynthesis